MIGIGTDIVQQSRMSALLGRFGNKLVQRILTSQEQVLFSQSVVPDAFLAKRFAAKEAVAKALGTGIGKDLAFNEISVTNLPSGQPIVTLLGKAQQWIINKRINHIWISLSDEKEYSIAFVIIT